MKLYWRIKKDGKWTWKPARNVKHYEAHNFVTVDVEEEE
jgi:hypothetical protein